MSSPSFRSAIIGSGAFLPGPAVTNTELVARGIDSSDSWIYQRTGIKKRHFAPADSLTSDLAFEAASLALSDAGLEASDLDMIVLATTTPDHVFPATATKVQARLGAQRGAAFDVQAVCAGFTFALQCADHALRLGQASNVLVIGAELYSRILDWNDRSTCVLFGDGAGAVVLARVPAEQETGILCTHIASDGRHYERLYVDGGIASTQSSGFVRMDGPAVFRFAVESMSKIVEQALASCGFGVDDLDWLIPHQANQRIIDKVGERIGIDPAKVIVTVEDHANSSAATIPIALDRARKDGRLQPGHLIALTAMGGGFSWGSALIRL